MASKSTQLLALFLLIILSGTARAQVGENTAILNPNLAGEEELAAIPLLSEDLVSGIIEARPFITMAAFNSHVSGSLDDASRAELYTAVFLPINLNTASDEEIRMIPGVGDRMLHEFREYRPYDGLARFHREIAKYVDDEELARLEQYVFVPIDLNTASDDAILSIPGIGSRMLREFKEYRPYKAIEQFRREMGKYVNEDEVARMERYVVIN